jgi:hypothetical protein
VSEPVIITPQKRSTAIPLRQIGLAVILVLVVVAAGMGAVYAVIAIPAQRARTAFLSLEGASKARVLQRMGTPKQALPASRATGKPIEVPWVYQGYVPKPTWPARGEVLIYANWNTTFYVYLDEQGNVEHVDIAGT